MGRRTGLVLAPLLLTTCLAALSAPQAAGAAEDRSSPPSDRGSDVHLVLLEDLPAAAYAGGVQGYRATRPAPGRRFDSRDPDVQRYADRLRSRSAEVARSVGATPEYQYAYSLSGFAASLTPSQAARLRATPGVVAVQRDRLSQVQTDNTPRFLGLTAPAGVWERLGGPGAAGEDVVIGVVDTGIWPEHPSFSGTGYGPPPAGWTGGCDPGELFSKQDCNGKLIGARYFHRGYGHFGGGLAHDYQSARDDDGHGTHTASTAGGNAAVRATVLGRDQGTVSGMAPRARIAAYKACWPRGCATSDLVAAIDRAVADGVDVLNYSIGDGDPDYLDADDVAFLFARQAGVFVAASAGNRGPGPSTVDHGGPWLTTVAASTQDRTFAGTATLGDGSSVRGVTITGGLPATRLVDGATAGSEGCLGGLDPAAVSGAVVLCRGSFSRAARGLAVQRAGGVGMVLYTASQDDALMSDNHHLPALHVRTSDGMRLREHAARAGAEATVALSGSTKEYGGGSTMAAFSSRGPLPVGERSTGDLLKPDVTAPGVQVLAGGSPTTDVGAPGQLFQAIGGTSMSSPHVAGLAALLRDLHPTWTPDLVQSALMTSARTDVRKEDGTRPADPFDHGSGHIVPNRAADPGLVLPVGLDDYRAFLRSQGLCRSCFGRDEAPVAAPDALNVPSVTVGALTGSRTVTRTVRNVGAPGTWSPLVEAPPGIEVAVSPSSLALGAGQTGTFAVTLTTGRDAVFDRYAAGSLTWVRQGPTEQRVRLPLVARPVRLTVPASLSGSGTSGSAVLPLRLGYSGPFSVTPQGPVPATTEARTVADDPTNDFDIGAPHTNQGTQVHEVTVAAGSPFARVRLFDEHTDGDDDLDLFVYRVEPDGALTLVALSAGVSSAETVDLLAPTGGTYRVYVHGWQTDGRSADYTLFSWVLPPGPTGTMTATSSTATASPGASASVTVAWSGLTSGSPYLGRLRYADGGGEIGSTLVSVAG